MGRESFILYKGFWEPIKMLSNEQLGRLFRALYEYQVNGAVEIDPEIAMAFGFFKHQFDLDSEKYEKKVERIRNNASAANRRGAGNNQPELFPSEANNGTEPQMHDYVEALFFRNIVNAEKEAVRFVSSYESSGWILPNGYKMEGYARIARAELWKPDNTEPRFSQQFLDIWREIYKELPAELRGKALKDKTRIKETYSEIKIYCQQDVYNWIMGDGRDTCTPILQSYLQVKRVTFFKF